MDRAYLEAKKRVKVKKDFYKELSSYVGTSILLIYINVFSSPGYLWCLWAIVPWGITLFFKGIKIMSSNQSSQWEENEIRKELIAMGKDPDDYIDEQLELKEIEMEELDSSTKGYKNSDLV
jgi:hypothetical protein